MTMLTGGWVELGSSNRDSGSIPVQNFEDRISDDDALLDLEEDYSTRRKSKRANVYIRLMANYPIVIALASMILGGLSFVTIAKYPLPDFDDPTAGFEARGTSISGAHRTLKLMKNNVRFMPNISIAMKSLNISHDYMRIIQQFIDQMNRDSDRTQKFARNLHKPPPITYSPHSIQTTTTQRSRTVTTDQIHITDKAKPTENEKPTVPPTTKDEVSRTTLEQQHRTISPKSIAVKSASSPSHVEKPRGNNLFSGFSSLLKGLLDPSTSDSLGKKLINISNSQAVKNLLNINYTIDPNHALSNLANKKDIGNVLSELQRKPDQNGVTRIEKLSRRKRSSKCISIVRKSVKVVFEERNGGNLWTADAMRSICRLQDRVILPSIPNNISCKLVSLPELIAEQQNKKCQDLNDTDMQEVGRFLRRCSSYACLHGCPNPAKECLKENGEPLTMAYFLMDKDFFNGNITEFNLKYTMVFYNEEAYRNIADFGEYYQTTFSNAVLQNEHVKITAVYTDVNDKFDLFNTYMKEDLKYFILAGVLVLSILTFYLGSVALIIATLINVVLSLGVAYFFYKVVLRIAFFPFMNVLAGIILIAVGADDVFIYYDTWQMVKKKTKESDPQEKLVSRTFRHAAVSIFVTSLTTSGAFFANYISRIAAIRCFGVFAGLAILANFVFMVTWTPSVIVLCDQICNFLKRCVKCRLEGFCANVMGILNYYSSLVGSCIFAKAFPFASRRLWLPLVVILTGIGVYGFVVVFVKPRLNLPDSKEFPLFPSHHLMENYDQNLRDKFRWQLEEAKEQAMSVYFVWGAFDQDNGNHLDPNDDGTLKVDPDFSLIAPESQTWMKNFCNKLKVANFSDDVMQAGVCLLDMVETTQQRICSRIKPYLSMLGATQIPFCCVNNSLPYSAEAFQKCFPLLLNYIPDPMGSLGEVMFDHQNNITGFLLGIKTKQNPTTSYTKMDKLVSELDSFLAQELASAPKGLKNGWYMGTTESFVFYDLQKAISHGTYSSIELSLAVACITMFLCTLNPLVTLYSMVTISFAIAVTIGSLVLMGWHLNIVESVTISLAVGLSIDFTIHFGVAYVLSQALRPKDRVEDAFVRVGPAVAMAALTTFVAGASVMPSRILAYRQLGLFLMIVMATSWVYANFFFQPVCAIIGPIGCQIPLPWKGCKKQVHYENPASAEQLDIHSLSSVDSEDEDNDVALILNG